MASASGIAPSTMAPVVIKMGRSRKVAARCTASMALRPVARNWLANSTIKMPCLVIKPTKVMSPIWLYTFKVLPVHFSANKAPTMDSGTDNKMTNGSTKLSNCAANTKKMNTKASTKTPVSEPEDCTNSRELPFTSVL